MISRKNIITITIVSSLSLAGCSSNDEYMEQQTKKTNTLESQINALESQAKNQQYVNEKTSLFIDGSNDLHRQKTDHYRVKENDTLHSIATEHGLSLKAILQLNPQIKKPNTVLIGHILTINN